MAYNREKDKDRDYQSEINQAVANNDFATASALEKDRNEKIDVEGLNQGLKTNQYMYDAGKDYQAEIDAAVSKGDFSKASSLEKERNRKIDGEKLDASLKTNNYNIPTGMTGATYNAINTPYKHDDTIKETQKDTEKYLGNVLSLTDKNSLLNPSIWNDLDASFRTPSAVAEADKYLASQLDKIQSGKTSYSDQVSSMLDKIMNREKFSYDVDNDPLFQQALASSMNAGKTAMQDTIGQASALTGGYGSTYATTAGNQAYNSFIEDAYDNLPQYYQMALDAYNMEGEEMYRQFGALSDMDDKEYNKMLTSFDATNQYRNNLYNEAYTQFRDTKTDALNKANLQLSEHGQLVSDAYNAYSAMSDYSKTLYERSYNEWADKVNWAIQKGQMEMDSYWNQTNFDEGVRQYEKNFDESVRQYEEKKEQEQLLNFLDYIQKEKFHKDEMDYNYAALNQRNVGGGGGGGGNGSDNDMLSDEDLSALLQSSASSKFLASILTPQEFSRRKGLNESGTEYEAGKLLANSRIYDNWFSNEIESGNEHETEKSSANGRRYDNWGQYASDMLEKWYDEGKLTENEVNALAQYIYK